jgi:signal peptidase I
MGDININDIKGINFSRNKYVVRIQVNNKRKYIGGFNTIEEAIVARKEAEQKYITNGDEIVFEEKHKYKQTHPKLYQCWAYVKQRCLNLNNCNYKDYGGRGITICDEWKDSPESFCEWALANNWKEGLELDRIDVNGNYEPSNCQIITHTENKAVGKMRKYKCNKTGYNGVRFIKSRNVFRVEIGINGKNKYIGEYSTVLEAVHARTLSEIEYFGEQKTNIGIYSI